MLSIYTLSSFAVGVACGFFIRRQWGMLGKILHKPKANKSIDNEHKKPDNVSVTQNNTVSL
jgi:hypothetical protein